MNTEKNGIGNLESAVVNAEISRAQTLTDQPLVKSVEDEQRLGISCEFAVNPELGHIDQNEKAASGSSLSLEENGCHPSISMCSKSSELEKDKDETTDGTLALNPPSYGKSIKQSKFHVNDLVWAKVRNYPWWPGQIFNPSDASDQAKKYQNRHGVLIGFFGDQTFAWNELSRVKPFHSNFTRMEKQSTSESFLKAIGSALDELSRRVQFGLSCRCYPAELSNKIKTQIVVNAGINEKSSRREFGGDNHSSPTSFLPIDLIHYVKQLAENPLEQIKRFDFAIAHAQLLAFDRWKGCDGLSEFKTSDGLFIDDDELIISSYRKVKSDMSLKKPHRNPISSSSMVKKRKMSESDSSSKKQLLRVGESMCRVATLLVRDSSNGSNGRSSSSSGIKKKP